MKNNRQLYRWWLKSFERTPYNFLRLVPISADCLYYSATLSQTLSASFQGSLTLASLWKGEGCNKRVC